MDKKAKVLFVYPEFPKTFWGFQYALPFLRKKSSFPPLGLLTVASLLPESWEKKLVDLNIQKLNDKDLKEADFIFLSAMIAQKDSAKEVILRAKKLNKKIVAGGPLFTTGYEEFEDQVDHFILGEGENTLPAFVADWEKNNLQKIYKCSEWPDIKKTPAPMWKLVETKKYASMSIQFSRGCPFNCEFCDIVLLNGRLPRAKSAGQVVNELEGLYQSGWRGSVFFVDDNFIGNKIIVKKEILPAIEAWMKSRKYPFSFNTQASINLADDQELMKAMVSAGFNTVFIGIESPDEESLKECGKFQNTNRNLLDSIKIMQNNGLQVQGGFIIGFDQDNLSIFERMQTFIQKSGISMAMIGLLQAMPKTRLWERLAKEKRLISESTANNTDNTINFIPKMNLKALTEGYRRVLSSVYSPKYYYQRLRVFLREYRPKNKRKASLDWNHFEALLKSVWILGIKEKERFQYWKMVFWTIFRKPKLFPTMIEMAVKGFHFRKVSEEYLG